jgi:hypothetical protein
VAAAAAAAPYSRAHSLEAVAAERDALHQSEVAALNARIRELEGDGGGRGASAVAEGMAEGARK